MKKIPAAWLFVFGFTFFSFSSCRPFPLKMSYKSVIVFTGLGVCVSYGDYVIMPVNDKMKLVNGSV